VLDHIITISQSFTGHKIKTCLPSVWKTNQKTIRMADD
jgi:hypothetical protein